MRVLSLDNGFLDSLDARNCSYVGQNVCAIRSSDVYLMHQYNFAEVCGK